MRDDPPVVLHMLVEATSMRAISRMTGVSINTVTKLLVDAGRVCIAQHRKAPPADS